MHNRLRMDEGFELTNIPCAAYCALCIMNYELKKLRIMNYIDEYRFHSADEAFNGDDH